MQHLWQMPDVNYYHEVVNPVPRLAMYNCEFLINHQDGRKRDIKTNFFPINRRRRVLSGLYASYKRFAWTFCGLSSSWAVSYKQQRHA